jgi:HEAT repeat protein
VLADLAQASRKVPLPVDSSVLELVRPYLRSEQTVLVQNAAVSLGGFEDEECIADLVQLLSHPDTGVRGAAHEALRSIAGVGLWPDVARWTSWLEGERTWHEKAAPGRIEEIRSGGVGDRARAIADLAEHPLYRNEIATELQSVLPHAEDEIRLLGIRALGQLGAATAVPFLESCSLDPQAGLAAEARLAIARIQSQRDHPGGDVP